MAPEREPTALSALRRAALAIWRGFTRDVGLKLLSVVMAFGLWFFVNAAERDTEQAFQVAVELHNLPPDLILISPPIDFVDLRVTGPRTLLARIDPDRLTIPLDLSGVRPGPAVFRLRTDTLNLPRGVNIVRLTPSEVTLQFARRISRKVPVRVAFQGKPPTDLRVTETSVAPEEIEIIGPEPTVRRIEAWETEPLDLSHARAGLLERDLPLAGPPQYVSLSARQVHVTVRLEEPEDTRVLEKVPVVVRNTRYRASVQPQEVRLTVRGPRSAVRALELIHGAVYIDGAGKEPGRYKLEPKADLPAGLSLVKVQPPLVQVRIFSEVRNGVAGGPAAQGQAPPNRK